MTLFRADTLRVDQMPGGVACLWLDVPGKGQNVLGRPLLTDLDAALDHVVATPTARVLVVRSAKPAGFLAGADLHDFAAIRTPQEAVAASARGQQLFAKLAGLRLPSIAVIHGTCLGGGLELALACDYRLVVERPDTQLGLPEVELGLLPAWGGTQRLPRIVGLERALNVILGGRRLGPRDALRWRLADALSPEGLLDVELARLIHRGLTEGKRQRAGLPLHTWRQRLLESNGLGRWLLYRGAEQLLRKRVPDDMPAPGEALRAVQVGVAQGLEAGLAYEREAISRLATSPACRNLINLFLQREQARRLPDDIRKWASEKIRKVGVVGAGTMGAGIAQLAAVRGYDIVLREANADALGAGIMRLQALFQKAVQRGILSAADAAQRLRGVKGTLAWDGFEDADLVIEAALEDLDAKRAVFRELDRVCRPDAVLASNTSSLSLAAIAEGLTHRRRVAGCHFFNPVHKLPLVEVVRGPDTDDRTIDLLRSWAVALNKVPVVVRDGPGFVVNRVLAPYLAEAVLLVAEGNDVRDVDRLMHRFGMVAGPLETLDQVGLDVAAHVSRVLQPAFADRWPPSPAFAMMVERGWLGQKNGWGFYRYAGKRPHVNEAAVLMLRDAPLPGRAVQPVKRTAEDELVRARDRLVLLCVNEAAACLAEGLAADAEAVDLAMVLGAVWAPHRGGPLHYADDRGLADVVQRLTVLARDVGPRFQPHPELARRAASGQLFHSR
jgi:3-hydroxyacyl-CoA dehydrogenase/enoyl-CoA hydratase/3-hydroxybutyryl-CoA epimerase